MLTRDQRLKLSDIKKVTERIYNHENEAHISAWHVREAIRMLIELIHDIDKNAP